MTTALASARAVPGDPWRALVDAAAAPYRAGGRFGWHFARGKLGRDPVFPFLLRRGLIAPGARVLDIGCGQGLLASLLRATAAIAAHGSWPAGWAQPPLGARVIGIERMASDVRRANGALQGAAEFYQGDMRSTPFPRVDTVIILDVLHYVAVDEQDAVLERVRAALPAGGRLLLRVGDAGADRGVRASLWVDRLVTLLRSFSLAPMHTRPLAAWKARLDALGFRVVAEPMSQGTPFANVLLVATLPGAVRAGAAAASEGASAASQGVSTARETASTAREGASTAREGASTARGGAST